MTGDIDEIVRRAASGEESAWNEIVGRFENLVWATIRGIRLSDADTEDVWQTTWLRLAENIARLREPRALGGWLAQTARHEAYRLLRARGRELPGEDELHEVVSPEQPTVERLADEAQRDAAWRALARLSDACQRLLRLLTVEPEPSYAEVSAALEMPIGSIGPTRQRCLEKLRRLLADDGFATA